MVFAVLCCFLIMKQLVAILLMCVGSYTVSANNTSVVYTGDNDEIVLKGESFGEEAFKYVVFMYDYETESWLNVGQETIKGGKYKIVLKKNCIYKLVFVGHKYAKDLYVYGNITGKDVIDINKPLKSKLYPIERNQVVQLDIDFRQNGHATVQLYEHVYSVQRIKN
jgi:hypothetical protein